MTYLLDTNVLTCLHDGRLLESLSTGGYACSVISEIEILSWPGIAPETESERRWLLAALHSVEVDATVREAAIRRRREHRLKIPRRDHCRQRADPRRHPADQRPASADRAGTEKPDGRISAWLSALPSPQMWRGFWSRESGSG